MILNSSGEGEVMTIDNGEWRMENGEWTMENGEWIMDNGEWRMDNCVLRGGSVQPLQGWMFWIDYPGFRPGLFMFDPFKV